MYMYEENFKRKGQDTVGAENAQVQEMPSPSASTDNEVNKKHKKPLTIKKACIIAAAILIVSGIAVFFILSGGDLL